MKCEGISSETNFVFFGKDLHRRFFYESCHGSALFSVLVMAAFVLRSIFPPSFPTATTFAKGETLSIGDNKMIQAVSLAPILFLSIPLQGTPFRWI